jgi:hypothetical protein
MQKRDGVEMKSFISMASMLLFIFATQAFGSAFVADEAAANDSINITQMNETLKNVTIINGTLENVTIINGTLENVTIINGTNESNPFADAKNRLPSRR